LIQNGIEPWVTLYHWDLPSALNDKTNTGGWLNPNIPDIFAEYADFCFKTFGSKVRRWITINEPQSVAWLGYGIGVNAPGRCSAYISDKCQSRGGGGDTPTEVYTVSHHIILAHAKSAKVYREKY
jgi:beta-glucosidase